jgi:hypothetical protein
VGASYPVGSIWFGFLMKSQTVIAHGISPQARGRTTKSWSSTSQELAKKVECDWYSSGLWTQRVHTEMLCIGREAWEIWHFLSA